MGSSTRPSWLSAHSVHLGRLPGIASTAYVTAAAIRVEDGHGRRTWVVGVVALVLSLASTRGACRRTSFALWAVSIVVASLAAARTNAWLDAFGMAGAFAASLVALRALEALLRSTQTTLALGPRRRFDMGGPALATMLLMTILWGGALLRALLAALHAASNVAEGGLPWDAAAGMGGLVVLGWACQRLSIRLQRALGPGDRARVLHGSVVAIGVVVLLCALLGFGSLGHLLRLAIALASLLVVVVSGRGDPVTIARAFRRATVVLFLGGPLVVLAVMASEGGAGGGATVFVLGCAGVLVGSFASKLEAPLRPAGGRWLDAVDNARQVLGRSDADGTLREILLRLREPAGAGSTRNVPQNVPQSATDPSPEIWTLDPPRRLRVDRAGYVRESESVLPPSLVALAEGDFATTVRAEDLEALESRRPELQPLTRWMSDRGALCATLMVAEGEVQGALVLPRGSRAEPLSLEEVRAFKALADSLSFVCEAKSAVARSLAREKQTVEEKDAALGRVVSLESDAARDVGRHVLASERLAQPATVGVYSAPARQALATIERILATGAPLAVLTPSGVDAVPYIARAHLCGPRRQGAVVIVEGTLSRDHDVDPWYDPNVSPLALAHQGLLVLIDGPALPFAVQRLIASSLFERRAPWKNDERLDIAIALTSCRSYQDLVRAGRFEPSLAARFGDALQRPVCLPRLRDRPEDIRAILTDRLAREGLRVRGAPVGLDDAGFARLAEYDFPGEDAEIAAIVVRLVASASAEVVRAKDVDALGLASAWNANARSGE